jgi:nucleoside-diphosphate-sugar epimerase
MVHRDDAAGAVRFLLERNLARGETVLVVDDEPVEKHAFADWLAAEAGRESPPKRTVEERLAGSDLSETARDRIRAGKRCSNARLRDLGYEFAYPTFREGYRNALDTYRGSSDRA